MTREERFWQKVERRGEFECWLWRAAQHEEGYGRFWDPQRRHMAQAHRVAYQFVNGPIPDGFHVHHLCANPQCVNPAHLEALPPRENAILNDGPTAQNIRKTRCKHGHEFTTENTYITYRGRRHCRACHRDLMRRRRTVPKQEGVAA